jgi:hypothetical protein
VHLVGCIVLNVPSRVGQSISFFSALDMRNRKTRKMKTNTNFLMKVYMRLPSASDILLEFFLKNINSYDTKH